MKEPFRIVSNSLVICRLFTAMAAIGLSMMLAGCDGCCSSEPVDDFLIDGDSLNYLLDSIEEANVSVDSINASAGISQSTNSGNSSVSKPSKSSGSSYNSSSETTDERRSRLEEDDEGLGIYDDDDDEHYFYGADEDENNIYDYEKYGEDDGTY